MTTKPGFIHYILAISAGPTAVRISALVVSLANFNREWAIITVSPFSSIKANGRLPADHQQICLPSASIFKNKRITR